MNEEEVLTEALEKMYEGFEQSHRIDYLKKQYDLLAKGKAQGQFAKGLSDYKEKVKKVQESIKKGNPIDTPLKKGFVCAAIEGLESQLLHSQRIIREVDPNADFSELNEKLKHIDSIRKKYCDRESPIVDEVVERLT